MADSINTLAKQFYIQELTSSGAIQQDSFHVTQYLNPNSGMADGSGGASAVNAKGDYSGAEVEFFITPADGTQSPNFLTETKIECNRLLISIKDTAGFSASEYGNLTSALTNGIQVVAVQKDSNGIDVESSLTCQLRVHDNDDWATYAYDVDLKSWGSGDEMLVVRMTFDKWGKPIVLQPGDKLIVRLNDDFTGLIAHYFVVEGLSYR